MLNKRTMTNDTNPDEREKEREGEKITAGRAVTVARDIYPLSVNLFVHT